MGAGLSINSAVNAGIQRNLNSLNIDIKNECKPKCSQIQANQEIIIVDSTVGDIRFDQECNVNAQCAIQTSVAAAVKSIQKGHQDAGAKPTLTFFGGQFSSSVNDSTEVTNNLVKEMILNQCGLDISQKQVGNLIYVESSKTGDISFDQKSNDTFSCSLKTSASISTQVDQQTSQTAKSGGLGKDSTIIFIIIAVVVAIIIVGVLASKKKGSQTTSPQRPIPPRQQALLVRP